MKLAVSLLALVAATHFGYDWLAMAYEQRDAAARAWFYIARGIDPWWRFA